MAGMLRVSYKWHPACEPTLSLISVMFFMGDHKYAIVQMGPSLWAGHVLYTTKGTPDCSVQPKILTRMT